MGIGVCFKEIIVHKIMYILRGDNKNGISASLLVYT